MESTDLLRVALEAARMAAAVHQRHVGRVRQEDWSNKGSSDFVSFVDREAEACIVELIRANFPDHQILAEEAFSAAPPGARAHWFDVEYLWLVDPLDGTANFLHGYPAYCSSVAVAHRGRLLAGAVVSAPTNEEWCAQAGQGATRNGQPIKVSNIEQLESSLIGTGTPFKNLPLLPGYLVQFETVMRHSSDVRRAGAAALDLCHVASGYFDGFWELDLYPWDIAAGALMVREAGGIITRMTTSAAEQEGDNDLPAERGGVIAGNPMIHQALRTLLRSVS
ncbi:MAG: inositol monophosphatase family protein [Gemmatimonadota bacterium]